ncbi:tetratricopeptide repeat protein [Rickettsia bellii]|uniref:tetratricopeptide repeat protein n=1 Tax=Rickettsia bellii TaxID=33990 RepID=UPI001E491209|nr:tetratricopeptide repeat protein [Rickettsia bellii]
MSKTIEVIIESESEDEEEYFEPLSDDVHNFNFLKEQALKLLPEVNYLLKKAGKENVIVIGPSDSGRVDVLKTLTNENSEQFSSQYASNINLPKGLKVNDKVLWECSNKIKTNTTDKESILQALVNRFFLKNILQNSDKVGFIVVAPQKTTVNETVENFIAIIDDFIDIFPEANRENLKENVTFVVTKFNKNTQEPFVQLLKNQEVILEYFPQLFEDLYYLYASNTPNEEVTLKLENINMSEKKINIKKLNSLFSIDHYNAAHLELVQSLYDSRESNISKIYDVIRLIFTEKGFNIYTTLDCSKFCDLFNYNNFIQPFSKKLNYPALETNPSHFPGLQQLFELEEVLKQQDNDKLPTGLKVLSILKKFVNDKAIHDKMEDYYYVLDQQIREVLFFKEALNSNKSYKLEICKSFIKDNYLSSIKNIQPQDNKPIEYYREAIKWLNIYNEPKEIEKTKSACYLKIANLLSKAENYEEALANYHYALKYNENCKTIYNEMADILYRLGKKQAAVEFYKPNNKFFHILKTLDSISNDDIDNVTPYRQKGDYLISQKQDEEAAYQYILAMSVESTPCKKQNILFEIISALEGTLSVEPNPTCISVDMREKYMPEVIGKYPEII